MFQYLKVEPTLDGRGFESQPQFTLNLIVDLKLIVSKINIQLYSIIENYNFYY